MNITLLTDASVTLRLCCTKIRRWTNHRPGSCFMFKITPWYCWAGVSCLMCMCRKIIRLGLKFLTVAKLNLIRSDQMAVDLTGKFRPRHSRACRWDAAPKEIQYKVWLNPGMVICIHWDCLLSLFGGFMDFYFVLNSLLGLSIKPTDALRWPLHDKEYKNLCTSFQPTIISGWRQCISQSWCYADLNLL